MRFLKILLLLLVVGLLAGAAYVYAMLQPVDDADQGNGKRIEIVSDQAGRGIAKMLDDQGLIRDQTVFYYYLRFFGGGGSDLKAGYHWVSSEMDVAKIVEVLKVAGPEDEMEISLAPGQTIYDFAQYLADNGIATSYDQALMVMQSLETRNRLLGEEAVLANNITSIEGYLFPETYRVSVDATVYDILERMVTYFKDQMLLDPEHSQALKRLGLSVHQWVIFASLVEGETVVKDESVIVASLYYSRWRFHNMPLQCDAAVKYGLLTENRWDESLAKSMPRKPSGGIDWQAFDNPYNVYHSKYTDLPPGPINNPSGIALLSVLNARQTDIKYMYADYADWGHHRHCFSRTGAEHSACIQKKSYTEDEALSGDEFIATHPTLIGAGP